MINYLWPVLLVVAANIFYNIATKSTPNHANPFALLVITYLVGAISSFILFLITSGNKNIILELKSINWTSFVLGISIVALEAGYIYMYRAGWAISAGSLVANVILALALILVGMLLYKEHISISQICGILLCITGLVFIYKK